MVKKKPVGKKKLKKKGESWLVEDVQVATGLPPHVDGQLRCFLRLSVSQILWMIPTAPDITNVRVQWWGEDGEGAIFRPVDVKKDGKAASKTTARYAVRSGPKQFAAYLNDMGSLVLEVLSGAMMVPVGRCQVEQISLLSPSKAINGFFPVFSPDSEKIAELQVSLMLESLMGSYDSMGSIPTTDMSTGSGTDLIPTHLPQVWTAPAPTRLVSSTENPFISPATRTTHSVRSSREESIPTNADTSRTRKSSVSSSDGGRHTPMGLEAQQNLKNKEFKTKRRKSGRHIWTGSQESNADPSGSLTDVLALTAETSADIEKHVKSNSDEIPTKQVDMPPAASSNLLSLLVNRGEKLKEAMIVSSLNENKQSVNSSHNAIPVNTHDNGSIKNIPQGKLLHEILCDNGGIDVSESWNVEGRTVDLILGPDVGSKELQMLCTYSGSLDESLSGDDDVPSDPGDPLHDTSLLQDLFYKNAMSEESLSCFTSDEEESVHHQRSHSNSVRSVERGQGHHRRSSSLNSLDDVRNHSRSNSVLSLEDPGNVRPPSRHSSASSIASDSSPVKKSKHKTRKGDKMTKKLKKREKSHEKPDVVASPRGSECSRVSFDRTQSDTEENGVRTESAKTVDGLSVERLTLLGRVHAARVVIDKLILTVHGTQVTPSKKKTKPVTKGKPPRP